MPGTVLSTFHTRFYVILASLLCSKSTLKHICPTSPSQSAEKARPPNKSIRFQKPMFLPPELSSHRSLRGMTTSLGYISLEGSV